MSVYNQVVKFAQQIKNDNIKNKIIYVKGKNVYLINKNELPNQYYQKTNILIVDDPKQYLREINKEPTQNELDQFKFVGEIIQPRPKILYEPEEGTYERLPQELIREQLLKLPIQDIVRSRRISREHKDVVDSLWCDLIDRDYKGENCKKDKCEENYKKLYKFRDMPKITLKKIDEAATKHNLDKGKEFLIRSIENIGFIRYCDSWHYDPKTFMYPKYRYSDHLLAVRFKNEDKRNVYLFDNDMAFKFFKKNFNIDIYEDIYNPLYTKYKNMFKEILPSIFHFDHLGSEYMDIGDIFNLYQKVYGKKQFEKDFTAAISKHPIFKNKHVKMESVEYYLQKFYNILNNFEIEII